MASFNELRDQLGAWRVESERLQQKLLLAHEGVKRGRKEQADVVVRLEHEEKEHAIAGAALWKDFQGFTNPKDTLPQLEDRYPILLFPLRIETRFKQNAQGQRQLWVRVYPDQCLIDAFEPSLTEQEIENAQLFWAGIWRAGGVELDEQAAWRDLTASHGAGRAGWIVRHYEPLNPSDKPQKDSDAETILVIRTTGPVPPEAFDFWRVVWKAGGTDAAIVAARPALEDATSPAIAAEIIEKLRPVNLADVPTPPYTRETATLKVVAIKFGPFAETDARRSSWSRAPHVDLLPERLVCILYRGGQPEIEQTGALIRPPLVAGPDPNAPPERQLKPVGDSLQIPDAIAWMFDFEAALEAGMAFRINLTVDQAIVGFDRLVIVGVRLADSAAKGRQNLETLLEHHLHSRDGLEIIPQGTPTNNTEKGGAGYTVHGDPASGFKALYKGEPLYGVEPNSLLRRDGQWLADTLGLDHSLVQRFPNADGGDQTDARAMHLALWPATLGYMMRTMMQPVFGEETIGATRWFFANYVLGRGSIPALRVGAQPYGILPTTAFSRINWLQGRQPPIRVGDDRIGFLARLYAILLKIDRDWEPLLSQVSYVGKPGVDPHQLLLDVLGLHPSSAEYYPLKAESQTHKFHHLAFLNFPIATAFLTALAPSKDAALQLLRELGYTGAEEPDVLTKLFGSRQPRLDGPIIDDPPLSETEPIGPSAGTKNYIEWLLDAMRSDIQIVQEERGFDEGKKPRALLYLILRHAVQLVFHVAGVREQIKAGVVASSPALYAEPAFVHVEAAKTTSESRYAVLYERLATRGNMRVADVISRNLGVIDPELADLLNGLDRLTKVSTARLERAFAEHIDCACYRLDAWKQGLLQWQLERMRAGTQDTAGLFLGAFGWLEDVRPENKVLTPVTLPPELDPLVNKPDDPPLVSDSTNLGLIHAPSLNHATSAAVLRNGYHANGGRLAVDLSSRRVRRALNILDGMRNGQSLGALLGYHLERHVHDSGVLAVRAHVFALRRKFPLVANRIASTKDESKPIEAIAAMNVVDGLKLLNHVEGGSVKVYPWGFTDLPSGGAGQADVIDAAVADIRDINDAVSDLALAEGVHQAVAGNFDRSAGTLEAFAKGNYPPEPDVIRTPRTGTALVLRTAVHLDPNPPANPSPTMPLTPLAKVEAGLNAWLTDRMPEASITGCSVSFVDRATDAEETVFVRQQQLGLHAIDLIYQPDALTDPSLRWLDDRVLHFVHLNHSPRLDRPIRIEYTKRENNRVNFFELQALVTSLRVLVVASRPLQPIDLVPQTTARASEQPGSTFDVTRLTALGNELDTVHVLALAGLVTTLATGSIDAAISAYVQTVSPLAFFRLPQTGIGFTYEWRAQVYEGLAVKLAALLDRWSQRLADATTRLDDYDNDPALPEQERIEQLGAIEMLVSTSVTFPVPPSSTAYRTIVGHKLAAFQTERSSLADIAQTRFATLDLFLQSLDVRDLIPFDFDGLDLDTTKSEIARFREQLIATAQGLKTEIEKRVASAGTLLGTVPLTVEAAQNAAKLLLGDDFQMIPSFTLSPAAGDAVANAWSHSASGDLTKYSRETVGRDFPVDDWLHGVARVRDKMRQWENAIVLSEAFNRHPPELMPLQLPFVAGDAWFALEIPPAPNPGDRVIDRDRLLYTAHFAVPFDKTQPVSGLLVDEWTEVIPEAEETSGVAFHLDRPNSEPPQCWLLALPAVMNGTWSWDELVDAINGALDAAKRRAIEPTHIEGTPYTWLLPATYAAYTFPEVSISNYLLRNVDVFAQISKG